MKTLREELVDFLSIGAGLTGKELEDHIHDSEIIFKEMLKDAYKEGYDVGYDDGAGE